MSIEERVKKVVSEQLDVSGDIDNNASFIDDLGADSLDTVELVMSLEEEFDCEIPKGDEQLADSSRSGVNYQRSLDGFFEISPGTYRGTQFYFNGGSPELNSGTGLGHSINNTQLGGFRYRYDIPETTAVYRLGLYELKRIKPVLDANGSQSSMIGVELDNTFTMLYAGHAKIDLDINAFQPGRAFSYDDQTVPTGNKDMIYHFAGRLTYSF